MIFDDDNLLKLWNFYSKILEILFSLISVTFFTNYLELKMKMYAKKYVFYFFS